MTRRTRLVLAYAAVVVLLAGAAFTAFQAAAPDDGDPSGPRWAGRPLAAERRTVDEVLLTPVRPRRADRIAARVMGDPRVAAKTGTGTPVTVEAKADRPVAEGTLPDEAAAEAAAARVFTAFGLDPAEWAPRHGSPRQTRTLRYAPRVDLPVLPFAGVGFTYASFELDAKGLRAFAVSLVRLATRPAEIISEREAFERVAVPGRYTDVRLVLIDDGKGRARPYWDFSGRGVPRQPILAVLTP